jgi:hypothetical protein
VIALACFRREEDVNIILDTKVTGVPLEYYPAGTTFIAISKFPHPGFLPFLESHLQPIMGKPPYVESTFLYEAISSYNSKEGSALLARAFQITGHELRLKHLEQLSRVLKRNSHPVYNDLRQKIASEVTK